jgi:hypothetical protein
MSDYESDPDRLARTTADRTFGKVSGAPGEIGQFLALEFPRENPSWFLRSARRGAPDGAGASR